MEKSRIFALLAFLGSVFVTTLFRDGIFVFGWLIVGIIAAFGTIDEENSIRVVYTHLAMCYTSLGLLFVCRPWLIEQTSGSGNVFDVFLVGV